MERDWISKSDVKGTRVKLGKDVKARKGKEVNNWYDVTFLSNVGVRRIPERNGGRTDKGMRRQREEGGTRKAIVARKK